jgi:hypothetical protein
VVLGPLVPNEARQRSDIIDTTLGTSALIEEPVASGGDSSFWAGDDDEKDEDEPGGRPR